MNWLCERNLLIGLVFFLEKLLITVATQWPQTRNDKHTDHTRMTYFTDENYNDWHAILHLLIILNLK